MAWGLGWRNSCRAIAAIYAALLQSSRTRNRLARISGRTVQSHRDLIYRLWAVCDCAYELKPMKVSSNEVDRLATRTLLEQENQGLRAENRRLKVEIQRLKQVIRQLEMLIRRHW